MMVGAMLAVAGCSTQAVNTSVTTERVLIASVNTGMNVWRDYVVAGKATQSQIDTVHTAYDTYYNAQQMAKAAIEKALAANNPNDPNIAVANASVAQAEQALLNILNQYIK